MKNYEIRRAVPADAAALYNLYYPHLTTNIPKEPQDMARWSEQIARLDADGRQNILVAEVDGVIASSVKITVIENLTHNMRPYSLIENVVTNADYRKMGIATALMNHASEIAEGFNCYKIMLLTGSKLDSTLNFYRNCGYDGEEKTGFIKYIGAEG